MLKYKKNIHSQNGEDGILEEIFRRMHIEKGLCCEFGSSDGFWMSNTRALIDKGWQYVHLEASRGQFVTPENVNELVPQILRLLSIDIDGNDYEVWKAYNGFSDVVVIEINSSLNPEVDFFDQTHGCNFSQMLKLGKEKGYFLLCHTGNMVFVRKEHRKLFQEAKGKDIDKFDKSWLR